ncbi:nucleoside-diphosphate-sugar epimerase GsfE [Dactylonectria estremocensis]|uniref:Nucleoside-diphosphate-sugar epimerase GsfE n=1 Tax=Dactylonectria estremocensis TaxID=1079267 RepID=A0A9P9EYE9_9HYPO|nr:nucleoside-diphosphate-sugar epimerase GsfE [Dactylonectria estremocensis]
MASTGKVAFVTGGNGISGNALVERLIRTPSDEWSRIIVTSKSSLIERWQDPRIEFIALDFLEPVDLIIGRMTPICQSVTHAFFTSYVHSEDFAELPAYNIPLFKNFLTAIDTVAGKSLQRVCLQTGAKNYGLHLGPMAMCPAPEDCPRYDDKGQNFYFSQEDYLFGLAAQRDWSYSVIRPKAIIGYSPSKNGISESITLALYFLICRELGEEARFVGNSFFWNSTDDQSYAPSLADMTVWAMTNQDTQNQVFNHANGDVVVWRYLFPKLAAHFGATPEYPTFSEPGAYERAVPPFRISEWAMDKREVWHRICDKYGGKKEVFDWATWDAMEWVGSMTWLSLISLKKARKFGWTRVDDTYETWLQTYKTYEMAGTLPPHDGGAPPQPKNAQK